MTTNSVQSETATSDYYLKQEHVQVAFKVPPKAGHLLSLAIVALPKPDDAYIPSLVSEIPWELIHREDLIAGPNGMSRRWVWVSVLEHVTTELCGVTVKLTDFTLALNLAEIAGATHPDHNSILDWFKALREQ